MHQPAEPLLVAVTDRRTAHLPLPDLAAAVIQGGADFVQVRERDLSTPDLMEVVREVVAAVSDPQRIMVNGDIEVARRLGTGLHLREHGIPVADARKVLGRGDDQQGGSRQLGPVPCCRCRFRDPGTRLPKREQTGTPPAWNRIAGPAGGSIGRAGGSDRRDYGG